MRVSNFELLVKRISPINGSINQGNRAFRRVIQGYFLTISNLEATTLKLGLIAKIADGTGNRVISTTNTSVLLDVGVTNNVVLPFTISTVPGLVTIETEPFKIPPYQTALVALLPIVNPQILSSSDLEIRGFSILKNYEGVKRKILVTPEHRGTFLDNDYPNALLTQSLDFDQIAYSLPISTGKAENILLP